MFILFGDMSFFIEEKQHQFVEGQGCASCFPFIMVFFHPHPFSALVYPESFDLGLLVGSTNERTNEGPEGRKGERSGPLSSSFLGQPCPSVITAWDSSSSGNP